MKLKIEKTNVITDITTWFKYAEPEGGESQWVKGRSAMEFARYMTQKEGVLPKEMADYLSCIGVDSKEFTCYPEYVTSYDGYNLGTGSGRHHDGLLVSKDCIVGIEAKVSESFDRSLGEKLASAKKNSDEGENMKRRIMGSLELITGKDYSDDELSVSHLMYQLISATAGTAIEAEKNAVSKAVVMVVEFIGPGINKGGSDKKYNTQIRENAKAYKEYLNFLGIDNLPDIDTYIITPKGLKIWYKKLVINVKKQDYEYTLSD